MKNEQSHEEKVENLKEVRKILPETLSKVEHYKECLVSEGELLKFLQERQSKWYVSNMKKLRERVEIVNIKNSILSKQTVYESYLKRKKAYEKFLDEMILEVSEKFEETIEQAKTIKTNVRLLNALEKWESDDKTDIQNKIDFYLYLKTEIKNNKKYSKKQ